MAVNNIILFLWKRELAARSSDADIQVDAKERNVFTSNRRPNYLSMLMQSPRCSEESAARPSQMSTID